MGAAGRARVSARQAAAGEGRAGRAGPGRCRSRWWSHCRRSVRLSGWGFDHRGGRGRRPPSDAAQGCHRAGTAAAITNVRRRRGRSLGGLRGPASEPADPRTGRERGPISESPVLGAGYCPQPDPGIDVVLGGVGKGGRCPPARSRSVRQFRSEVSRTPGRSLKSPAVLRGVAFAAAPTRQRRGAAAEVFGDNPARKLFSHGSSDSRPSSWASRVPAWTRMAGGADLLALTKFVESTW